MTVDPITSSGTETGTGTGLRAADRALLLRLLDLPTAGRLETGPHGAPPRLREAQEHYAQAAAQLGFRIVEHRAPDAGQVLRGAVPDTVRQAVERLPGFLAEQPSLLLALGPPLPREATVMFNVHLDTVAGGEPARFDGTRFHGRGAIDAKGPAVALLAGIRAAIAAHRCVGTRTGVLIQAVAGEEGGAMGTFGTRPLVERGFVGRLNVFCEPTGLRYLPRSRAALTARVRVDGDDAIDDRPGTGHNASVLLGFLAWFLGGRLDTVHGVDGAAVCVAGLHTGTLHNRVYGSGELLVNVSYGSTAAEPALRAALRTALDDGLAAFTDRFTGSPLFGRTAADAALVTQLDWPKSGLPALNPADPHAERWTRALLGAAGLRRWPDDEPAFTCDAIWLAEVPGCHTVVFGPGDLAANRAHAPGEHADLADLDAFAGQVAALLGAFDTDRARTQNGSA